MEKPEIQKEIKACLLNLLIHHPFFGFLVAKMDVREVKDSPFKGVTTACTDGKNIYYNWEFMKTLEPKEKTFVIGHEIMHCVLESIGRSGDRDFQYWNMATDYVINAMLKKEGIGIMPKVGLYDPKYDGMIAEQVYDLLEKGKAQKKETLDHHLDPNEMDQGGDGKDGGNGQDDKDGNGQPGGKGGKKDKNGKPEGSGGKITQKEIEANKKAMREMIVESYQQCKMAGNQVGGVELFIQDLINPKINWKQLLQVSIQSLFKDDITWRIPNRRNPVRNMILPTLGVRETVDICVSIDTSGSISDEQRVMFLSEIAGILNYYGSFKLKMWCFDTEVHNVQEYDQQNITDLANYQPAGGGGTDIGCNFKYLQKENIVPKQLIVLTDAYNGSDWGPTDYCNTTWIIHSNPKPDVPWGRWAIFEDLTGS